jgi:hypothetical protein
MISHVRDRLRDADWTSLPVGVMGYQVPVLTIDDRLPLG